MTLGQAEIPERIVYARAPRKLPEVLSADEVVRFLEAVPSLKTSTALTAAYAAGLRVSEVVGLKVADIDSQRGVIRVRHGLPIGCFPAATDPARSALRFYMPPAARRGPPQASTSA